MAMSLQKRWRWHCLWRCWLRSWRPRELETRSLVARLYAPHPLPSLSLRESDELVQRHIGRHQHFQEFSVCVQAGCVRDEVQKCSNALGVVCFQTESLANVLLIIKRQMRFAKAGPIGVIQILLEGVDQETKLVPQTQKHPVLIIKACEEWQLEISRVANILNALVLVDIFIYVHLQCVSAPFCLNLALHFLPACKGLLPCRPLLLEPAGGLQMLC